MPSYERINYLLRPNKSVERKMVCEMLMGISSIRDLSKYQYIGFGSTYFADFSLFHRRLGISRMISIEGDEGAKDRCEFNKPYACIDLKIGKSTSVLPNLSINSTDSIIWLDYDESISDTVFSDIDTVITMMRPDSFFMLSINAEFSLLKNLSKKEDMNITQFLAEQIGEARFPNQYLGQEITAKTYLKILYECITQEISSALKARNGIEKKVAFHQSVFFVYKDGARMMTIGGFLFQEDEMEQRLEKMGTSRLCFYQNGEDPYMIQCPIMSVKEIQALNSHLPCAWDETGVFQDAELNQFPIDNQDIIKFASLYRYFPSFVETLL